MGSRTWFAALLIALVVCPDCKSTATAPVSHGSIVATPAMPAPPSSPTISVAETTVAPMRAEPRVTLTASDGTGLRLQRLAARAVVDEPLALTEMAMAFENPLDRTLEGTFRFTLPQGATVSRFAMRVGEAWQEGEVVELQSARRAYEDFLHRKQDPALLEQAAGSEFSARVFPIPPHAVKELIVSYSQEITPHAGYTLPLRGLPELGVLDVELEHAGAKAPEVSFHHERVVPGDVALAPRDASTEGLESGELVLMRVRPQIDAAPEPLSSAVILFDTSASRALGFADQLNVLTRIVGGIVEQSGARAPLTVACFDQSVEPVFQGEAGSFGAREVARIEARGALGASNLDRAIAWAGVAAKKGGYKRVVLVTDGVATAGATGDDALVATTRSLREAGVDRLDAVAVGGIREDAGLRRIVTAGLEHDGVVADGALDEPSLARRLSLATRSGIAVKIDGATWSWPRTLDGVQPGDERTVYAEVPAKKTALRLDVGGKVTTPRLRSIDRPLLERSWAQAKIQSLLDERATKGGGDTRIPKEIVQLSVTHRVVSPYTAMIVLETENDYARFHIDRRAVADILTIDHGAIAVAERSAFARDKSGATPLATATSAPTPHRHANPAPAQEVAEFGRIGLLDDQSANGSTTRSGREDTVLDEAQSAQGNMWGAAVGDSFGAGGLGLTGAGEGGGGSADGIGLGAVGTLGHGAGEASGQGFGSGHGRIAGSHAMRAPTIRMGATEVSGRLPPEVIQRIVRQNFGRFRACYESGLRQDAGLEGRVVVRFSIDRGGAVSLASDGGSDLPNPEVVSCVVRAFTNLSFPEPEGGTVTVVYPIVFSPEGGASVVSSTSMQVAPALNQPPSPPAPPKAEPYGGRFKEVMDALAKGDTGSARTAASAWHDKDPGDVLGLVALGETLEAAKDTDRASRAYGSIIDLFPARADLRRFAGARLEHLAGGAGLDVAIDTYTKANDERPDHPSSHRLLAFALLKKGLYEKAFEAGVAGLTQRYPAGRFAGADRVLREDLGLIGAAWAKAEPARRGEILKRVTDMGGTVEDGPSLRFVLTWETDANDVDFHIFDAKGGHAFYSAPTLPSGGNLYADVTTGYGPECFTIRTARGKRAGPYTLQANYYSRGPMGYGMGKLEIIDHDGAGGLTFEERPYVVMVDHAFVDLGTAR
jgi:hypothetical protein